MDYILVPKREHFEFPEYLKDSDLCVYGYFHGIATDEICNASLRDVAKHFRRSKHFARDSVNRLTKAGLLVKNGSVYLIKKPVKR